MSVNLLGRYECMETHRHMVSVTHCVHADQIHTHHADCVLNYPAVSGLGSWITQQPLGWAPELPSSLWALNMKTVSWITQQPLGWAPELPSSLWAGLLNYPAASGLGSEHAALLSLHASIKPESVCVTYGFMLNRSRITMAAYGSRLRLRSEQNLSLVQVMWTRSGDTSGLSFRAAWDAVFLSWISWACAVITSHIKHYSIMQMTYLHVLCIYIKYYINANSSRACQINALVIYYAHMQLY